MTSTSRRAPSQDTAGSPAVSSSQSASGQLVGWHSLFDRHPCPTLLVGDSGVILAGNPAALAYLGWQAIDGESAVLLRRMLGGAQAGLDSAQLLEAAAARGEVTVEEQALLPQQGQPRLARLTLTRLPDDSWRPDGARYLCTLTDLPDSSRLRQAVALKDQAELRLSRAEAASLGKSQWLSRISHELRTPLNAILGFTQLLEIDLPRLPEPHRPYLGHILKAGGDLLSLVDEVLDLNRAETGQLALDMAAVSLLDEARVVLQMLSRNAIPLQVSLQLKVAEAPLVRADARRVREVIANLVSNAIKYNRFQGQVWLTLGHDDSHSWIEVHDQGRGLSEEQQSHLFEPFNRLGADRTSTPGHGLGLSICKAYSDAMGGQMTVSSILNQGSRFRFSLPRWDRPGA